MIGAGGRQYYEIKWAEDIVSLFKKTKRLWSGTFKYVQIKLEGVIREIIGSGHRFVCLVRQQIQLVLVIFFLEQWWSRQFDMDSKLKACAASSTAWCDMQGCSRPDCFLLILKNRVSTKDIGLLSLNTATTLSRKETKKKGTEYRN